MAILSSQWFVAVLHLQWCVAILSWQQEPSGIFKVITGPANCDWCQGLTMGIELVHRLVFALHRPTRVTESLGSQHIKVLS